MSFDSGRRTPTRGGSTQELWPKWMWIAVPVLVVVVVAGLWWAIFSPTDKAKPTPTPTPTMRAIGVQPTQGLPVAGTVAPTIVLSPTYELLPLATFTPTPLAIITPTSQATAAPAVGLAIGSKAKVTGTGGTGLNVRAGAGTGHARVKTLPDGSVVEIIGGPTDANSFTWWQIRDETGATGWVVSRFLVAQ
jgi:hypothetical protein